MKDWTAFFFYLSLNQMIMDGGQFALRDQEVLILAFDNQLLIVKKTFYFSGKYVILLLVD